MRSAEEEFAYRSNRKFTPPDATARRWLEFPLLVTFPQKFGVPDTRHCLLAS